MGARSSGLKRAAAPRFFGGWRRYDESEKNCFFRIG